MRDWFHQLDKRRLLVAGICVVLVIVCLAVWAPHFAAADTYQSLTESLDEKRGTAIEVSAVLAGASVLIAAVPGDATTPIADQIASMNSYLIVVIGAIMLEKYLLPLIGMLVFYVLFPAALLLGAMFCLCQRRVIVQLALAAGVLGIALLLVIPVGVVIGDKVDQTYGLATLSGKIEEDLAALEKDTASDDTAEQPEEEDAANDQSRGILERVTGFFADTAEKVTETVSEGASVQLDKIKVILGDLLDAIAALILSTCVIPILVVVIFYGMAKYVLKLALTFLSANARTGDVDR